MIAFLIALLASEDFRTREVAEGCLAALNRVVDADRALEGAMLADDPEVRWRARRVWASLPTAEELSPQVQCWRWVRWTDIVEYRGWAEVHFFRVRRLVWVSSPLRQWAGREGSRNQARWLYCLDMASCGLTTAIDAHWRRTHAARLAGKP